MCLKPGSAAILHDTFYSNKPHLFIVISEPLGDKKNVIVVNVNSWYSNCDETTILCVGDHPFISHKSYINYRLAESLEYCKVALAFRRGKTQDAVKPEVLKRIQMGLINSPKTPRYLIELYNQA